MLPLAAEVLEKNIWYPTILGILVVVFAILLFCGSAYLLLATNLGARLGFLIAFTGLMAFMVILTSLWVTTKSPLNTLRGRLPKWEAVEFVTDPTKAEAEEVRAIEDTGRKVDAIEAANVKAAVDEELVQIQALPSEGEAGQEKAAEQKFAKFQVVTDFLVTNTFETGGSEPNPLDFELTHKPLYAVVQFCEVQDVEATFGLPPPEPKCDKSSENNGFLILQRDLGSVRIPPIVAWFSSVLLFGLGLLALHWRERDEQEAAKPTGTELAPTKA